MKEWVEWHGGDGTKSEFPEKTNTLVKVKFRSGNTDEQFATVNVGFYLNEEFPHLRSWWDNRQHQNDIVAYRVIDV